MSNGNEKKEEESDQGQKEIKNKFLKLKDFSFDKCINDVTFFFYLCFRISIISMIVEKK